MSGVQLQITYDNAPAYAGSIIDIFNSALLPTAQTTGPITSQEAATALDHIFSEQYSKDGKAGSFLWWFWDLVHDLASQVPHDSSEHDQFTAVIKALHDLPPKEVALGEEWGSNESQAVLLWTNLPMFGNTFREKLDTISRRATETEKKQEAINFQAYGARVAGLGLVPLEMYAIWALVDALEGTMKAVRGAPDEIDLNPSSVTEISFKVKIAAVWMIHAGRLMYGRDEEVHGATAGPLWKLDKKEAIKLRRKLHGTNGLCPQRWKLWKERFAAIRDAEGVDVGARQDAEVAFDIMSQIEREQK